MNRKENIKWIFFSLLEDPKQATQKRIEFKLLQAFFYAFMNLSLIYLQQSLAQRKQKKEIKRYIILGSQASHHHANIFRFLNFNPKDATTINTYDKKSFTSIKFLNLIPLFKELSKNFFNAKRYIMTENNLYKKNDLIDRINSSIAVYSYFKLLFKEIKLQNPEINIYSGGAELASLAAIANSLNTHYISHGLLGLRAPNSGNLADFVEVKISDNNFPQYKSIYVYSDFEINFLSPKLRNSTIIKYPFQNLSSLNSSVILFFEITNEFFDEKEFFEIVKFFQKNNFKIFGKEHPANLSTFPAEFCHKNGIELIKGSSTAYEIITEKKPRFTLGWPSTSLCESLNLGVIPICIPDTHPFFEFKNFYPFQSKTISWKKEFKKIESLVSSKTEYDSYLRKLRED